PALRAADARDAGRAAAPGPPAAGELDRLAGGAGRADGGGRRMSAGLILAAGAGTRFGGGVKQLAPLRGRPLLEYAVEAMLAVPVLDPVVVVLGHAADEILRSVELGEADVVVCREWERGQSASLRQGVEAAGDADAVV